MSAFDVTTRPQNGQWVNEVEGAPHLSRNFLDKEDAVEAARQFAVTHHTRHQIEEPEATEVNTDPATH